MIQHVTKCYTNRIRTLGKLIASASRIRITLWRLIASWVAGTGAVARARAAWKAAGPRYGAGPKTEEHVTNYKKPNIYNMLR